MAILSDDKSYVTVEKGDNLWDIAKEFLGSGTKYKQLASINGINDADYIYVGQKIKLTGDGSAVSSTTSSNMPVILHAGPMSTDPKTLFITWKWDKSNTDSYKVSWKYNTGDGSGVWFTGNSTTISVDEDDPNASKISTYQYPENAREIKFKVKPISKTKKDSEGNESTYWTANWSKEWKWTVASPIVTPPTPSVAIDENDKLKLNITLDNLPSNGFTNGNHIEFRVIKNNTKAVKNSGKLPILKNVVGGGANGYISYSCNVAAGALYKVCCRAWYGGLHSEWSDYSSNVQTVPVAPSRIKTIRANSETSIYLEWEYTNLKEEETGADTYEIEYTTEKNYFDGTNQTTKVSSIEFTHFEITGLESGDEYFFRVRAINEAGESTWTDIVSVVLGSKPAAPTTWSSTTTAITGEPLTLYWVHNSEDGSKSTYAQIELFIYNAGSTEPLKETHLIQTDKDYNKGIVSYVTPVDEEEEATRFCLIDTSGFNEGAQIQWRARTAGITKELGAWSAQRTIDIYAPPSLELDVTDSDGNSLEIIESFPFYIRALSSPETQTPIGYSLIVTSNDTYETSDNIGNAKNIKAGDQVYSKYFDIKDSLLVKFTPSNIDLENNISYTATCIVSMDSGLTATSSCEFTVSWGDISYTPNAEIGYDRNTYTTFVRPYCEMARVINYKVNHNLDTDEYVITDEVVGEVYSEIVKGVKTTTGEQVYLGTTSDDVELYYCVVEETGLVEDVTLSVYRREFDGTFTELGTGIANSESAFITDPHPALDYARYRIVATTNSTGAISYYDIPAYPIGEKAAIIQWDEAWSVFDTQGEDDPLEQPAWSGSLLRLPYDVDVSDSYSSDVTLIEYVGRKHPVTYYGTQLGESQDWNVNIPKDDEETLYALRRLAIWMGDVYVREPSGTGFWANVSVSFSQKHLDLIIPVSIKVTRVEGGA